MSRNAFPPPCYLAASITWWTGNRYLRATPQQAAGQEWMVAGGKYLEGNVNPLPAKLASAGGVVRGAQSSAAHAHVHNVNGL